MTADRLFPAPADPGTLTERQAAALDTVDLFGPLTALEMADFMGYRTHKRESGLGVLRELHRKGLVRRVGRGGGRWALSEPVAEPRPGDWTARSEARVPASSPTGSPSARYDPDSAEIPF